MSTLKNKVQLVGHLGKDPEAKYLDSGKVVVNFTLATSETYRNGSGEKVTDTQWHSISAWGKTGEIADKYLCKGSEVAVEGKLVHRSYEDKNGEKKYITEVVVNEILMLGNKSKAKLETA